MKRSIVAWTAALLMLSGIARSQSDLNWMYAAPPLDQMVAESSLIAIGVADSSWVEIVTGFAIPITVYPFQVEEVLYCEPLVDSVRSLTVGCPGGKDPRSGDEMWISHAARLSPGARQVAFLKKVHHLFVTENFEHFTVTKGEWGISGVTEEGVLVGGAWNGEPLKALRAWIVEAAFAKSPQSLLNRADALVKAKIDSTQIVTRPNSSRFGVTSVTVLEWLKGKGEKVISVREEKTITGSTTWKDRAYLPEAQLAMIFLERHNGAWRVLDGPNGLFCITTDGKLFAPYSSSRHRYIGLTETELIADLQLDAERKP